jgi:DNA-binding MarR family transcriptional regulator
MADHVDLILKQWRLVRPDLDPSPMGIIGRISRLSRAFERSIAGVLAEYDLSPDEFDVLATLRRAGKPFALKPSQLSNSTMVTSGTMTHRLDKLASRAMIERRADPNDRRGLVIKLTAKGRRLVDRAVTAHLGNEAQLLASLSGEQRSALSGLLRLLAAEAGL